MQYVNLGRTGLKVSRLCLGMMTYGTPKWRPWVLDEDTSRPFVRRALELGINFFDTADMYSLGVSEEVTGRAVRDFGARDKVVVATKAYYPMSDDPNDRGLSRKHLMSAIDNSLRRLGTDYVDLYQIHRWDADTPIEETLTALHDIVRAGKARYIGASSMMSWQFARALDLADQLGLTRFVSMQNHYNLVYREEEREMLPRAAKRVSVSSRGARWHAASSLATAAARPMRRPPAGAPIRSATASTTHQRISPSPNGARRSRETRE